MPATRRLVTNDVAIDGQRYDNVDFRDCRLIYAGGPPPTFINCQFENTQFSFQDGAANTLRLLRAMAPESTKMRGLVLSLLPELQA